MNSSSSRLVFAGVLSFCCLFAFADPLMPSGGDDYQAIVDAITAAGTGGTVELGEGTFRISQSLEISTAVTIRGAGMDKTIITPTTTGYRGLYLKNKSIEVSDLAVSGFTGKGEYSYYGVGMRVNGGVIRRCHITRNKNGSLYASGTGVYIENANGKIYDSIVDFNSVAANNDMDGAGINVTYGTVSGCLVVSNTPGTTVRDYECGQSRGGGIWAKGARIENTTVADNGLCGIYLDTSASVVTNCIVKGHTYSGRCGSRAPDIEASTTGLDTKVFNTFVGDEVEFMDAAHGDYRLTANSHGTTPGALAGCIPFDTTADAIGFCIDRTGCLPGESVTLTANLFGAYADESCTWTVVGPDGTGEERLSGNPLVLTPDAVGSYSVTLSVADASPVTRSNLFHVGPAEVTVTVADSLEAAVANAENGTVITLGEGTHEITHELKVLKDISIIGPGSATCTILKTGDAARAVQLRSSGAVLEGVTVTGGSANDYGFCMGGGVWICGEGGTVRNCRLTGNKFTSSNGGGGGIAVTTPAGVVSHCVIDANTAIFGGGIYLKDGTVDNCLVLDNSAKNGGGLNIIGGAIYNCTFSKNTASALGGGSYYGGRGGSAKVVNCLFSGDTANKETVAEGKPEWSYMYAFAASYVSYRHCAFETATPKGTGSVSVTAPFADPDNGDYTIKSSSEARDAGELYADIAATDLAGNPRVMGRDSDVEKLPDIGCYEFDPSEVSCDFSVRPDKAFINVPVSLEATVDGIDGKTVAYVWTLTDESGSSFVRTNETKTSSFEISSGGHYAVKLEVFDVGQDPAVKLAEMSHENSLYVVPKTFYVKESNPTMAPPYDTWEKAHTNLHEVLPLLMSGCEVCLGEGTIVVTNQVEIESKITITGSGIDRTVVRFVKPATGANHRVFRLNHADAVVQQMTISGGVNVYEYNSYGGGVFIDTLGGTLQDCRVTGNKGGSWYVRGAGVGVNSAKGYVTRCVIDRNTGGSGHGSYAGIFLNGGHVDNCLVCSNSSTSAAGLAMYVQQETTVSNCTFACNKATACGAGGFHMQWIGNKLEIVNCVFAGNVGKPYCSTDQGSGAVVDEGELDFRWGSGFNPGSYENCKAKYTTFVKNCLFQFADPEETMGTNSLNADPKFVDAANLDFHLVETPRAERSPCIDAGLYAPWMKTATDLDGKARVKHVFPSGKARVDIGCYESAYWPIGLMLMVK